MSRLHTALDVGLLYVLSYAVVAVTSTLSLAIVLAVAQETQGIAAAAVIAALGAFGPALVLTWLVHAGDHSRQEVVPWTV